MTTGYGTTSDGHVIDDALVERLADEAEQGYSPSQLRRPRVGRPWLSGEGPAASRTVRLPASLDQALVARAEVEHVSVSEVVRDALQKYLATV